MTRKKSRRKPFAPRKPSGRIRQPSEARQQEEAISVVRDARQKMHGLTKAQSRLPEASSAIGRAALQGDLSPEQYQAAKDFEAAAQDFRQAVLAPRSVAAGDMDRVRGFDGSDGDEESYVAWCRRARERYETARRALLECEDALALMALETWILADREAWQIVGSLRIGLNALVRLWDIGERKAA